MNDELLEKLPYGPDKKPAEMWDVLHELTTLVTLIAVMASVNPRGVAALLKDTTKEPGQSVVIAQTRLGMALESWAGTSGQDVIEVLGPTLPELLATSFIALHAEAHS
jgi:hypothetical protein